MIDCNAACFVQKALSAAGANIAMFWIGDNSCANLVVLHLDNWTLPILISKWAPFMQGSPCTWMNRKADDEEAQDNSLTLHMHARLLQNSHKGLRRCIHTLRASHHSHPILQSLPSRPTNESAKWHVPGKYAHGSKPQAKSVHIYTHR